MGSGDFVSVWSALYSQLDTARNKWFELTKEIISDEIGAIGGSIVNEALDESYSVDMREDETPDSYPYNTVDGAVVESFIIGWQIQAALNFCTGKLSVLGRHMSYVRDEEMGEFFDTFVKTVGDKPRWIDALTTQVTGKSIAEEDVAMVLAHYLMDDSNDSEMVKAAFHAMCPNPMGFLKALSCASTAAAFGDEETMHAIHAALKNH